MRNNNQIEVDCTECGDTGEVEVTIKGRVVIVECDCRDCLPSFRSTANSWQNRDADAAGVAMYGEI